MRGVQARRIGLLLVVLAWIGVTAINELIASAHLNMASLKLVQGSCHNTLQENLPTILADLSAGSRLASNPSHFQAVRVRLYLHLGEWIAAEEALTQMAGGEICITPLQREGLGAVTSARRGDFDQALGQFRAAILVDPRLAPGLLEIYYRTLAQYYAGRARTSSDAAQSLYLAGMYTLLAGDGHNAEHSLAEALKIQEGLDHHQVSRALFYLGQIAAAQGRSEEALKLYRDALEIDPTLTHAAVARWELCPGDPDASRVLSGAEPHYLITPVSSGDEPFQLVGYDLLDETQIEAGPLVQAVLYWRAPGGFSEVESVLARSDRYVFQSVVLHNLISNGGFEWSGGPTEERPAGFTDPLFPSSETGMRNAGVVNTVRDGKATLAASVFADADESIPRAGLRGDSLPVSVGRAYLQAGWVRATGKGARFGGAWRVPRYKSEDIGSIYRWLGGPGEQTGWVHFANVESAPPETLSAEAWLMVNGTLGAKLTAYLDDVLFAEIVACPICAR